MYVEAVETKDLHLEVLRAEGEAGVLKIIFKDSRFK